MRECIINSELFGETSIILDTYRGFDDWQAVVSSKFALWACFKVTR